jgi:predicted metal-binding membrane protein
MTSHFHGASVPLLAAALSWTAMMALMMAPTVAPWVTAYHRFGPIAAAGLVRLRATASFAGGYVAVWLLFGTALALIQSNIAISGRWSNVVLAGAGLYQFSAIKQACLTHCRNPFSFLLARWKDGPLPAFQLGVLHGTYCLGCCWALMLTSVLVGLMSLWWMAVLAILTFIEQVMPWGGRLRVPIGLMLLALAALYR